MQLNLPARPPFSFSSVVRSHGWMQLAPFILDQDSGDLRYAHQLASGRVVDLLLQAAPGGEGVRVKTGADLDKAEAAEVARKVGWMLGLDMDFSTFYAAPAGRLSWLRRKRKPEAACCARRPSSKIRSRPS